MTRDPVKKVNWSPGSPDGAPVAVLQDLRVDTVAGEPIVDGVSLTLARGETLGVVGESGSGKTTTVLSLLGYAQEGAKIGAGEIQIDGEVLDVGSETAARRVRGRLVSYVPQNPGTALNPSLRIGDAIAEMKRTSDEGMSREEIGSVLESVGLPGSDEFQRRFPHQLSGGQQQRVCIAMALVRKPPVIVLDEPTTGLDVITQARILSELQRLADQHETSMVYVSHDLAVVAEIADRVAVMYAGRIVEEGTTEQILAHPRHPYTRGLLMTLPDHVHPHKLKSLPGIAVGVGERPAGCAFAPRCPLKVAACEAAVPDLRLLTPGHSVRCLRAEDVVDPSVTPLDLNVKEAFGQDLLVVRELAAEHRSRHGAVVAARDVSFSVARGECVALVGESGSGKTTIARTIAGLHPISGGSIELDGEALHGLARRRSVEQRRRIQMIFQNPSDALNPKHTVQTAIARPAKLLRGLDGKAAAAETRRLLSLVRLPERLAERYPAELSGGERQRVGIARALVAQPEIVVCDEITSALDVSVQAAVLNLLGELRTELGLGLLFITHDLSTVATIADRMLVLENGGVCEAGATGTILRQPSTEYTSALLDAAPSISHSRAEWTAA